jgi:hypothetical protein
MSTPKERPILFKGEMVRAILDGSKTQTRRVIKRQKDMEFDVNDPAYGPYWLSYATEADGEDAKVRCPFGEPGQLLWVRETFCIESSMEVVHDPPHTDGRPIRHHQDDEWGPWWEQPHYRATDPTPKLDIGTDEPGSRWRPSIFMPRWASRILLEITAVKVERLQSISEADARAEGTQEPSLMPTIGACWSERDAYARLWESINGPGSWAANPWVWVVEFRRVQP